MTWRFNATCGCGHATPYRSTRRRVRLDKVLHDVLRHRRVDLTTFLWRNR